MTGTAWRRAVVALGLVDPHGDEEQGLARRWTSSGWWLPVFGLAILVMTIAVVQRVDDGHDWAAAAYASVDLAFLLNLICVTHLRRAGPRGRDTT